MRSVGRFELHEEVGRGGQAVTWLGRDPDSGERVAIKLLSLRRVADWKGLELFEREAETLERLDHPAIPRYVDAFHDDSGERMEFVLVQEFVEGRTLEEQWEEHEGHPVFSEQKTVRFLREMLEVLVYLHGHSPPVVHRDIKPGNIFEREDGSFALVDFGAVQAVVPETMGGSTFIGTSGYMAPEQAMGKAEPRSDLFSLGATALQLLSGFHPGDLPVRGMKLEFRSVTHASEEMNDFLDRLLAARPADRFASAAAALDQLGALPVEESRALVVRDQVVEHGGHLFKVRDGRLEVAFPQAFLHPWQSLALTSGATLAGGTLVSFADVAFPVWAWAGGAFAALVLLVSLVFGLARPVLRIGPRDWTLSLERFMAPDRVASGRTATLEFDSERRQVIGALMQNKESPILILRDGVDERIVVLGGSSKKPEAVDEVVAFLRETQKQLEER